MIFIAILSFSYALIPQIIQGVKLRKGNINSQTSLITFIGMYALVVTYATLNLFFSAIMAFVAGTLWFILFLQTIIYR